VTPMLPALRTYQFLLEPPPAPAGSYDAAAATRGATLFAARRAARSATAGRTSPTRRSSTRCPRPAWSPTKRGAVPPACIHAAPRYLAAPAVLSRRQRGDAVERRRAPQPGARATANGAGAWRSGPLSALSMTGPSARIQHRNGSRHERVRRGAATGLATVRGDVALLGERRYWRIRLAHARRSATTRWPTIAP
jgi:hypothetical protein